MVTSLITSEKYKDHITGPGFPESPERLDAIIDHLESTGLIYELDVVEPNRKDKSFCKLVHEVEYITRVRQACELGAPIVDTGDNPISKNSYDTALLAVGGITEAVDRVFTGKANNAMALLRPPGHHAEKGMAMGFCLFNNVAIAARYTQQNYEVEKVAIIDFDVHHGNGTQHIFESDPTVMYISLHQYPFYPGSGSADEIGSGNAKGTTINYPLNIGVGDDEFIDIFNNSLSDKVLKYNPDLIIVSAGFDAHINDPIGGLSVTTEGYQNISKTINQLAGEVCGGKIISSLEGGYNLKALAESVEAHLLALQGKAL
ncbi:MAG: histone deacetylase [Candidatus Marinimicrobia bacterium]|jgi:acetoin utilization deacetylase AcuC-like enzyme|nr:histone deacetylase [Candidatus Neomarinimicrobiota bacterium]